MNCYPRSVVGVLDSASAVYGPSRDGIQEVCWVNQVWAIARGRPRLSKWQPLKKTGEHSCLLTHRLCYMTKIRQVLDLTFESGFYFTICHIFCHIYHTLWPRLPRALSTILKWDGPRFSAGWFGASPGHRPLGNQVIALPIWVTQAGESRAPSVIEH